MTWNDVRRRVGESANGVEPSQHVAQVVQNWIRVGEVHVGIKMGGVRGQYHPASASPDPDDLQTVRVTSDVMHAHARRDLGTLVHENHALVVQRADQGLHVTGRVGVAKNIVQHVSTGGEGHLAVLQKEPCVREAVQVSTVVVMNVSEDNVLDVLGRDADFGQRFGRAAQMLPAPGLGFSRIEADIHDDASLAVNDCPNVVVNGHGDVVGIGEKQVLVTRTVTSGVFDGVNFVFGNRLGHRLCFSGKTDSARPHEYTISTNAAAGPSRRNRAKAMSIFALVREKADDANG